MNKALNRFLTAPLLQVFLSIFILFADDSRKCSQRTSCWPSFGAKTLDIKIDSFACWESLNLRQLYPLIFDMGNPPPLLL